MVKLVQFQKFTIPGIVLMKFSRFKHPWFAIPYNISTIDKWLLWAKITCLKSAWMLFIKKCTSRYSFGLSKQLLCIIIAQGDSNLWPVKVIGQKNSHCGCKTQTYLIKCSLKPKMSDSFQTFNFKRSQFWSLLTYGDA